MTDVELTDEEYEAFLGMLSTEELEHEVERQRRGWLYEQWLGDFAREFTARWDEARADFDAGDKTLHDHVEYEAQKVVARRDYENGLCLTEDVYGDPFA